MAASPDDFESLRLDLEQFFRAAARRAAEHAARAAGDLHLDGLARRFAMEAAELDPGSEDLLRFWFGEEADDGTIARRQGRLWWGKDPDADRSIRDIFAPSLDLAAAGRLDAWRATPRGRLALIILLDQFSRTIHRGRAAAFAQDGLALELARVALERGDERHLQPVERVFLYMPFEHAEDPACQDKAVERFTALLPQVPPDARPPFQSFLDFALRHRDVIRRFGRFPHRNAFLGRPSTAEEVQFLAQPGSSF